MNETPKQLHEIADRATAESWAAVTPALVGYLFAEFQKLQDSRIAELESQLETERGRLVACGVAALGYYESCTDEYKSASLDDTLRLRKERDELKAARDYFADQVDRTVLEMGAECDELAAKLKETEHLLKDLLAVMHRDGGHHAFAVGLEQAVEDAKEVYFTFRDASDKLKRLEEQEPVVIKAPDYHQEAMGCGLEDRGIRDRYEAMLYGWECAIERMLEQIPEGPLYAAPVAAAQEEKP